MSVKSIITTREYGPMTTQAKFYPEGMTQQERILDLQERRAQLARYLGFDWRRMYVLTQSSDITKQTPGQFVDLSEYLKDIIATSPEQDLWLLPDTYGDIAYLNSNVEGIAIGYPTADCPVIQMATHDGDIAISHCGGAEINRGLPTIAIDSFFTKTGANRSKVMVQIAPFAQGRNYVYDKYPAWATDENLWKDCIIEKNGLFYINMRKALYKQINPILIGQFHMSSEDTITDQKYYSNNASNRAFNPDPTKAGRQFVGLVNQGTILVEDSVKSWIPTDAELLADLRFKMGLDNGVPLVESYNSQEQKLANGKQRVMHGLGSVRSR